jgi:hypothetical protein
MTKPSPEKGMMMPFTHGHALIIGVGADLPTTVDDARGLADILHDPARCAYPPEQVQVLTGEQATRENILAALEHLAQTASKEATVMVYFSGHGYRVNSSMGQAYYLMPHGYDAQRLFETAISGSEFASRLRAVPAQKLVLLLDCCHAGGVGEAKGLELAKAPLPPEAEQLLAEGYGRVLIASSREDERSYAGTPYSAFTLALIEALCGTGVSKADSYVRVADLALHTRQMVPGRTHDKQHPVLHFEQADNFVLAYYAGGAAQPKALPFTVEPRIEPEPGTLDSLRLQQNISGTATIGRDNSGQQTGINYGNMTQSTQTIHNKAPNEGAQGSFHAPVSFNRQHTAFDQRGQNVGGSQHNAARDMTIGQPQREPSRPRLSDMRLVQMMQAALEQQSLDDVLFALEGYASFTPDPASLGNDATHQARSLVQQCRAHRQRHALVESLRDFEAGLLGTPEEEAAWLAWAEQQDTR